MGYSKECLVCSKKTPAAGFLFCREHWDEYKDRMHEPWYRGIKNLSRQQDNGNIKYEEMSVVSVNHVDGEDRLGDCEQCAVKLGPYAQE